MRRRQAMSSIGMTGALAALGGCAMLKGGASHPQYALDPGRQQGPVLRLPVKQMQFPPDGVLQVEPAEGHPKLLVRRDADGTYAVAAAKCPHFGCVVAWDAKARHWVCPCHDSVFAPDGKVLQGPAREPLAIPAHRMEGDDLIVELPARA